MASTPGTIEIRISDHKPLVKFLEGLIDVFKKIKEKHPEIATDLKKEIEAVGEQYNLWLKEDTRKWS